MDFTQNDNWKWESIRCIVKKCGIIWGENLGVKIWRTNEKTYKIDTNIVQKYPSLQSKKINWKIILIVSETRKRVAKCQDKFEKLSGNDDIKKEMRKQNLGNH